SKRADIQGMRALAVLLVLVYHAGFHQLAGGYVGVDVFFVISGYIVTGVLIRDIENGRVTSSRGLLEFFWRRIKRLYPAVIATALVTFVAGMTIMPAADLERLARAVLGTIFAAS